jgi:hypothetical protein
MRWLQEKLDEHGQGKWEGKHKGKSDKRIIGSSSSSSTVPIAADSS